MPFVPFDNVIKIEGVYSWAGQVVENVHYYLVDETPNEDTARSLALAYRTWFFTYGPSITSNTAILTSVKWTIMEDENAPAGEYTTELPITGGRSSPSMPNNVTVAVKWLTAYRGRSFRGRTFHIGLTDDTANGSTLLVNFAQNLLTAYEDLIELTVDVGPAIMAVASRYSHGVLRERGIATPVINAAIDPTIDSQRRRLPGRGK